MKSSAARAAFLLSGCILFAGCGNDPNPKPISGTRPDGSPPLVYYYYMSAEAKSLDPQNAYDQMCQYVLEPVYDCLLQYSAMKTDPYEVEPCLLESMPEITNNADGTVDYLCKLKKGIFYHDDPCFPGGKGREVVAADEQFACQRMCDPQVECPVSANLSEYVAGMNEAMDAAKKNGGVLDYGKMKVSGIEVIDPHTFKLHLLKAYPQIRFWMAMLFTAPVAREAVEYYDGQPHPDGPHGETVTRPSFKFHPVGDGPFRIAEHIEGQRYRLVRNPNYHTTVFPSGGWPADREAVNRPLAGHALPLVDEVQLTIFRDLLPLWLLARQGYVDRMGVMHDAFNTLVSANKELTPDFKARGMSLAKVQDVSTFYMAFNLQDPVIGPNKKLRQALSCAYDPTKEIEILYGGVAPIAQQLLSPGIYGFQPDFKNPYGFDPEKAKRLIAEAGYPNGIDPKTGQPLELTIDCVANS
ncbi:MAG TPA: ABC transporter substrate-binding protein, partial [Chthoniobacteraceae bacterium]|nr:ABC transporter substrate-binding protein [Chthoniobacteraceae bacterium]